MEATARAFEWDDTRSPEDPAAMAALFAGAAEVRYVLRRATRLVDERARRHGLDPLEHQLLIQLFGRASDVLTVNGLSRRLDVPAAVGSRLSRGLADRGLVARSGSARDRRVTNVRLTQDGRELCIAICRDVRWRIEHFSRQLGAAERQLAISGFAFYLGTSLSYDEDDGEAADVSR